MALRAARKQSLQGKTSGVEDFAGAHPPKKTAPKPELIKGLAQTAVIDRAIEVIGDETEAMRWLGTPVRALNYATPVSLLHDANGRDSVLNVLGRLEHGIL